MNRNYSLALLVVTAKAVTYYSNKYSLPSIVILLLFISIVPPRLASLVKTATQSFSLNLRSTLMLSAVSIKRARARKCGVILTEPLVLCPHFLPRAQRKMRQSNGSFIYVKIRIHEDILSISRFA